MIIFLIFLTKREMNRMQVIIPDYRNMGVWSGDAWQSRISFQFIVWTLRILIRDGKYE